MVLFSKYIILTQVKTPNLPIILYHVRQKYNIVFLAFFFHYSNGKCQLSDFFIDFSIFFKKTNRFLVRSKAGFTCVSELLVL